MIYKIPNIYAAEGCRDLYLLSDPPHLLKIIRNSWHNSKRILWVCYIRVILMCTCNMQCNGKSILWKHLEDLYMKDTSEGMGLWKLPKLKYEHLHFTSFSKMRVDLAAQVHLSCLLFIIQLSLHACIGSK